MELTDVTGEYSTPDNVGGWGTPNIELVSVTEATLVVTLNDGEIHTIDVTDIFNNAVITNGEFPIASYSPSDFGLGVSTFPDGIYNVELTITDSSEDFTITIFDKSLVTCATQCCVDRMLESAMESYLCGKNCKTDDKIIEALKARAMLLQAIKYSFSCHEFDNALKLLNQANKICGNNSGNCGCGCS